MRVGFAKDIAKAGNSFSGFFRAFPVIFADRGKSPAVRILFMETILMKNRPCIRLSLLIIASIVEAAWAFTPFAGAAGWKAGAVSGIITPKEPLWMAGYGGRTEPSQGTIHDLFVKALALEDSLGTRAVIVTADIIGYPREFTEAVAREVERRTGIPRAAILFNASHTHCGPEIRPAKGAFVGMPEEYQKKLLVYQAWLQSAFADVIADAVKGMRPAELSFSTAAPVPFAVSRRFPDGKGGVLYRSSPSSYYTQGSRDDTVPVLRVSDPGGAVRAIVFGYACHPITMSFDYICGDYPGFAQRYVEEAFPGSVAMFVQGCAGELVPNSRLQIEYAMGHGRALAEAVKKALDGTQSPLSGPLTVAFEEPAIVFKPLSERKTLEEQAKTSGAVGTKAKYLLGKIDRNEPIPSEIPCPVQAFAFGKGLLLAAIGGETVVDYAVNIKNEFAGRPVWVAGYSNFVFGYLPTKKIVQEGGYEGGEAFRQTIYPGPFAEDVEDRVMAGARRVAYRVLDLGRPVLDVPFVSGKIAVDGSPKDWGRIKKLGKGISFWLGDGREGRPDRLGTTIQRKIDGEKDLRADVWAVHDGTYLYFLAEVHDDNYEPFDKENRKNMCYQEDMFRIIIDSANSYRPNIPEPLSNQPGYEGFGYSTDGNIYGDWSDFIVPGEPKKRPEPGSGPDGESWKAACTVKKLEDGYLYTYEERIALAGRPGRNMMPLAPGNSYGLNLEVCDADNGVQLEGYLLWSSDGKTSDFNYTNLFGRMRLAPVPTSKR